MHASRITLLPIIALGLIAAALLAACNGDIDDPDISSNLVAVAAFNPTSACVDVDGEGVDTNGDGTVDTQTFTSVQQTVTLDSRMRGSASSNLNDVIFNQVTIDYQMTAGGVPPQRTETITVTVPAGGTADVDVTTVLGADIPTYFSLNSRGNIQLTFRGHDIAGNPATAVGWTAVEPATVCTGN
ncbi:MAG: hypothetical protein D6718_07365 [Acidobacteria bacterium]|nr:MAG: hypothetical protein D6718_07365 [Acidobacteriota bacterium]